MKVVSFLKPKRHESPRLLASAEGQKCTLRLAINRGCVDGQSVACHIQFNGGIMGGKVSDIFIAFGCHACHSIIDGRINHDFTEAELTAAKARAMQETIQMMLDQGIFKLP